MSPEIQTVLVREGQQGGGRPLKATSKHSAQVHETHKTWGKCCWGAGHSLLGFSLKSSAFSWTSFLLVAKD